MLNKQNGNMYGFVTHTWNPIKGECSHDCKYCYMKVWKQKPLHLVEKELNDDLGWDNFIFVGSSTDMFAEDVPTEWIEKVLSCCKVSYKNKYLFQTKNPNRFYEFIGKIPRNSVLATTLETDNSNKFSKAPDFQQRVYWIYQVGKEGYDTIITIEPIMDFVLEIMVDIKIPDDKKLLIFIPTQEEKQRMQDISFKIIDILDKEPLEMKTAILTHLVTTFQSTYGVDITKTISLTMDSNGRKQM